jgi:hypothetical protein
MSDSRHLFVVLTGPPGQDDLEIPWDEWARWSRARLFREARELRAAARRPVATATTTTGRDRKQPAMATSSAGPDPADDLFGSVEPPPEAA